MNAVEILDLRVDYGTFTAVSNLTLSISKGTVYGLVGPNGAGKTSTLNVLATLLRPTYGTVCLDGLDIDLHTQTVRANLGYMPDLAPIIKDLKVWEFLDLFAACHGLSGAQKSQRVDACLDQVKMQDKRNALCGTLSRGMTQRVVLAKTILHEPKILLLDEPASGMDPIARIDLKDALQAIASTGTTIILSSHILSELSEMVGAIGILHNGKLCRHGPVGAVIDSLNRKQSDVRIDLVGDPAACKEWLAARQLPATIDPQRPASLVVPFAGGEQDQAQLLAELVQGGFPVRGFQSKASSLEDVLREISSEESTSDTLA